MIPGNCYKKLSLYFILFWDQCDTTKWYKINDIAVNFDKFLMTENIPAPAYWIKKLCHVINAFKNRFLSTRLHKISELMNISNLWNCWTWKGVYFFFFFTGVVQDINLSSWLNWWDHLK